MRQQKGPFQFLSAVFILTLTIGLLGVYYSKSDPSPPVNQIALQEVREMLEPHLPIQKSLSSTDLKLAEYPTPLVGKLTINLDLQNSIESLLDRYKPDYASVVAIHPKTGRILALVDYVKKNDSRWKVKPLSLSATFPAASVFKVVTAAAALEEGGMKPDDKISFNGKSTTLYKSNLSQKITRWTRWMTIESAFAKSANPVFGKLGLYHIGGHSLQTYADRFGFNRAFDLDVSLSESRAEIPNEGYGVAESASGFTRRTTLSPLQGAMIASAIANHGKMMKPHLMESISDEDSKEVLYQAIHQKIAQPVSDRIATSLAGMMKKTIRTGTARGSFRGFRRDPILGKLEMGGKTGSLRGTEPQGRYDWYIGYAVNEDDPSDQLAYSVMIINRKYWTVKSARLARFFVKSYFKDRVD